MVKMPIPKSASPNENSKEPSFDAGRITEIKLRLENAAAEAGGRITKHQELTKYVSEFVDAFAGPIIRNAASAGALTEGTQDMIDRVKGLNPFVAGELLLAIEENPAGIKALAGEKFLGAIGALDIDVQCALLYETRLTGNVGALTDRRLFTEDATEFFNRLGPDPASEWFNSIGATGNVKVLTSKKAMSSDVLDVIDGNAKTASEISYAIGVLEGVKSGKADAVTSPEFLAHLKALDQADRSRILSAIWVTRSADDLANAETVDKIGEGKLDAWNDFVRTNDNVSTIVLAIMNDEGGGMHTRGALHAVQSLRDAGFDVILVENANSAEEIADIATKGGASAIGISLMDNKYERIVTDIPNQAKAKGIGGIALFCGGAITHDTEKNLQQAGIRTFGQGTASGDMMKFLNASALRQPQHPMYAAGSAPSRAYAPLTASTVSNGARSWQAASYAIAGGSQTMMDVRLHPGRNFAAAAAFNLDPEESRKGKKSALSTNTNADARRLANGMPYIRTEAPALTNTSYKNTGTSSKIAGGSGKVLPTTGFMPGAASHSYSIGISSKATAPVMMASCTLSSKETATQMMISYPPQGAWKVVYAPMLMGVPNETSASAPQKAGIIESRAHSRNVGMRHAEAAIGTRANIFATMQIQHQNSPIAATRTAATLIAPALSMPSPAAAHVGISDFKRMDTAAVAFDCGIKFASLKLPPSRTLDSNEGKAVFSRLSPKPPHHKTQTAAQLRSAAGQPIAGGKGLKTHAPISWSMGILGKAVERVRKLNAARREKNLEKLLARSRESGDKLEAEAKRFGISMRMLKAGNYYDALGIKYTADGKAIREAYHALVKKHHPDVSKDADAEETTKRINEAYAVLKDKALKEGYDRDFSKGESRISAGASKSISEALRNRYMEEREKDFKEFNDITSVPLQREAIRSAIEDVCDWNKRFNKAASATFHDFRDYGKSVKRLSAANRRLLQKEKGADSLAKLKENAKRLDELASMYNDAEKGMRGVAANVRREIGSKESGIAKRLRALV
jgi:methylmalonyl-CoA mutase cobalamin-binding domain/chain